MGKKRVSQSASALLPRILEVSLKLPWLRGCSWSCSSSCSCSYSCLTSSLQNMGYLPLHVLVGLGTLRCATFSQKPYVDVLLTDASAFSSRHHCQACRKLLLQIFKVALSVDVVRCLLQASTKLFSCLLPKWASKFRVGYAPV